MTHTEQVTHSDAPEASVSPGRRPPAQSAGLAPLLWTVLPGLASALVLVVMALPRISDIDLYWHLIVGDDIRAGVPIAEAGRGWTFASVPDTWVSSQWLAEVLFSALHSVGGFAALIGYRVVTVAIALAILAAVTVRGRPRAGFVPFAIGAITLASATQERSQQLSFILAPLVGWWGARYLRSGALPRWWLVLPMVTVWANFHGGWILLPLVLGVAAVARVTSHGFRDSSVYKALALSVGCVAASAVSPLGAQNATTALTFSRAASNQISEWAKVRLVSDQGWQISLLLLVFVLCWTFGRARPHVSEVGYVLVLIGLQFVAYRNITPLALILAPLAADVMERTLPSPSPVPTAGRGARAHTGVVGGAWAAGVAGLVAGLVVSFAPGRDLHKQPVALISRIAAHDTPVRVLNSYNLAGPLLWFGGRPPHVRVGIDGRTDKYGAAYIDDYLAKVSRAEPGWQAWVGRLDPDAAMLVDGDLLADALQSQAGWRVVARESDTVLLVPPGATGW